LIGGETAVVRLPRGLPQFRLLEYKRGTLDLPGRLPPIYLRSLPTALFSLSILTASGLSTAIVLAVNVPQQFWDTPMTPLLLAGGAVAAATKSWVIYADHVERNGVENTRGTGFLAKKRQILVLLYAPLVYVVSDITAGGVGEPRAERTVLLAVAVVILLRVAYGIRASRPSSGATDSDDRVESICAADQPSSMPAPPSAPDGRPAETVEPVARSTVAAGLLNALTTGGVVDGRFSGPGLSVRVIGSLFVLGPGTVAAVTGSSTFRVFIACVIVSAVVFWVLSAVHMELAFGELEYRFFDSALVAYDRRLEEPQWSIPYDSIEVVTVERGVFWNPLWLDAGTVTLDLADGTASVPDRQGRASILFVPDPNRVSDWVTARRRDARSGW
jgi:hypothetical protein